MTTHCRRFLLFRHREDKTHKKTTKKKPREGRELTFKFSLCFLTFGFRFCPPAFALSFQVLSLGTFFSNIRKKKPQRKKNHRKKKCRKGRELTFKLPLCLLIIGYRFYPPTFALSFQVFYSCIFFFSSKRKKKKHKEKETIEKKKKAEKGRNLPSSSRSALSLLALASAFPLLHFHFKCFLLTSSSFQAEEKKKNTKKKKMQRKEGTYLQIRALPSHF